MYQGQRMAQQIRETQSTEEGKSVISNAKYGILNILFIKGASHANHIITNI